MADQRQYLDSFPGSGKPRFGNLDQERRRIYAKFVAKHKESSGVDLSLCSKPLSDYAHCLYQNEMDARPCEHFKQSYARCVSKLKSTVSCMLALLGHSFSQSFSLQGKHPFMKARNQIKQDFLIKLLKRR